MRIIYQGIDLMVLKTHDFLWEAVYDDTGTDYLYTRVTMLVEALVNGQVEIVSGEASNGPFMSYQFSASPTAPVAPTVPRATVTNVPAPFPPVGTGIDFGPRTGPLRNVVFRANPAPLTHTVVRHRLSTPQGKLFVFDGPGGVEFNNPPAGSTNPPVGTETYLLLTSPLAGRLCDCRNGPTPKVFNVTEAFGEQTYTVVWSCVTYVNEAVENASNPNGAILSNRFHQTHRVDENGYTIIGTEGVAIFRTDLVYSLPNAPDSGRATLFMPIPQGFERTIDYCVGLDDVTGVRYGYTDTQVPVNFVAGSYTAAAQIHGLHRQVVTTDTNIFGGALEAYERVLGITANRAIIKSQKDQEAAAKAASTNRVNRPGLRVYPAVPNRPPPRPIGGGP